MALPIVESGAAASGTMTPAFRLPSSSRLGTNNGYFPALLDVREVGSRAPQALRPTRPIVDNRVVIPGVASAMIRPAREV